MSSPLKLAIVGPRTPKTPASKRKVTPSAEESPSKIILKTPSEEPSEEPGNISQNAQSLVPSLYAPKQTHGHPSPDQQHKDVAPWHHRHVLVPYDLRDPNVNIFKGELRTLLYSIFPDTENVTESRYRGYLVFQVTQLPSTPWPLTVGGLPITMSEVRINGKGRCLMFPRPHISGSASISLLQDEFDANNLSDQSLRQLTRNVSAYFERHIPAVHVMELMFTCERTFFIVLSNYVDPNKKSTGLPGRIAKYPVAYLYEKDLNKPAWINRPAKREVEPQPSMGVVDDTAYDVLRPGVMISSSTITGHGHPGILTSTAGVLIKNPAGDSFMTAASHAIGAFETVWQTGRPDQTIGKAVAEISFTDICLVELAEEISFSTETFESPDGVIPQFTKLIASDTPFNLSTTCYFNSPYTGLMDSNIVMKSAKAQAEGAPHPTEERLQYVVYNWLYHGREAGLRDVESVELPNGVCGSPIWDDDGTVLGFYQFMITAGEWKGFSASVSASEVVEAGYTLAT